MESFHHRSTTNFKQVNKGHKTGRHESKAALKEKAKGRVESGNITNVNVKQLSKRDNKQERRNKGKQVLQKKKEELINAKRSTNNLPRLIGIIGLSSKETLEEGWKQIVSYLGDNSNTFSPITTNLSNWKQRVTLYPVERNINAVLDIAKVADVLIPIMNTEGTDDLGDLIVSTLKAQGVPTIIGALVGLESQNPKQKKDVKKNCIKFFENLFSDEAKLLTLSNNEEASQVLRYACGSKLKSIKWRENRPCMLIDNYTFTKNNNTLQISGYLRGSSINVNNLVHITDIGDFQLENIIRSGDPYRHNKFINNELTVVESKDMNTTEEIIAVADPSIQETLDTENPFDPFASEQTWPTDQEIQDSNTLNLETKHKKKLVPKGTSAYQASWFVDEDDNEEEDNEEDEEEEDEEVMEDRIEEEEEVQVEISRNEEEEEEMEEFVEIEENADEQNKSKKNKKSEEEDLMYPDEVDTPVDTPARMRFQKYRGLKSFRSSPWDPKENLPSEYSRIFQFQNFIKSKKKAMLESLTNVDANEYITLTLKNFNEEELVKLSGYNKGTPALLSGLLKYENKTSVVHYKVTKHHSCNEEVRSKDSLQLHFGFRRFSASPIYSQYNVSCDKHKYEEFLHAGSTTIASIYGPISFPPMPILMFKNNTSLVATGSLLSVDPDRIILKKIVLTGSPYKIHKRYAVVRHMFFNRDDINYFMPVEIYTKHGRTGRILEPLGTHGYMKVQFDTPILQHDTICMNLYKRVYPKWNKNSNIMSTAMEN